MGRPRQPIQHGTHGGYQTHLRRGEQPCEDCAKAQRAYQRAWRAKNADRVRAYNAKRQPAKPRDLTITVSCVACGGRLEEHTRRARRSEYVSAAKCRGCGAFYALRLVVAEAPAFGDPDRCGSPAGYTRHLRAGEEACRACLQAHAEAYRDRKERARQEASA